MASKTTDVIYNGRQKLMMARLKFMQKNIKKSGKNMHLEFKYFELEDIVPSAIEIFAEVGLVTTTNFNGETATMDVYNADILEEAPITFTVPYREVEQIVSNKGNTVTNALQALGSSITYLRRYLYMMVLDIVEHDDIDHNLGADDTITENKPKTKAPATAEERKAAKTELTSDNTNADEAQITELKKLCKSLIEKSEDNEEFIQEIALKTEGFTKITATACKELNANLTEMLKEYGE